MKKSGNRILILFCIVSLCVGLGTPVQAASPEVPSFYEDGDVVGFIGDSITHATYTNVNYVNVLQLYYLSRFPQKEVEFRNLGAAGYKVSDILNIYDKDPAFCGMNKAVIMLGTNEAILGISPEKYIGNMEKLIEKLKETGLKGEDILILSPPICDENCSLNYSKSRKKRWVFESRLLAYIEMLEDKTTEWGVGYLDIHTPMLQLTEEIQREDQSNTLTTDCIHPNPAGQMLIASFVLRSQGVQNDPLCGISVPEEGDVQAVGGEITDFYRGERGICFKFQSKTLPMTAISELSQLQDFSQQTALLFQEHFQVMGLSKDVSYKVYLGENDLGNFSGQELAEGINFAGLENHPMQTSLQKLKEWNQKRHQRNVKYRNIWVEIAMERAAYEKGPIQDEYEKWRAADEELRNEMYTEVRAIENIPVQLAVIEEDYSVEELLQDKKDAEERASREAEQAKQEVIERAKREAEELAKKQAEEARKAAEALEAAKQKAERESLMRKGVIGFGVCGGLVFLIIVVRKRSRGQR